tara:strand:+ start:4832 stop:5134 length:303 start_codon:yes stop_codon:yes gene_type:complete
MSKKSDSEEIEPSTHRGTLAYKLLKAEIQEVKDGQAELGVTLDYIKDRLFGNEKLKEEGIVGDHRVNTSFRKITVGVLKVCGWIAGLSIPTVLFYILLGK